MGERDHYSVVILGSVSTGSGSGLVSDQQISIYLHGWTRSLPLPVLTRSKNHFTLPVHHLIRIVPALLVCP